MIARYEQSVLSGKSQVTVQRYGGLQNLPHWHMESELIFLEKGYCDVMVENTVYTLSENGCVFIRSGAVHYIKAETDSVVYVMKIDSELISSTVGAQTPVCPLLEKRYPLSEDFEKIRQEISNGKKYYEVICAGLVTAMIGEIFRNEKTEALNISSESSAYKELLRLIGERYADITFDEAAEFMCFSKPYFSKYFRKMSGMTFSEYLNVVRVSEAVKMLSRGNISAGEAAVAAGFGTIRSFNRTFKRYTGFTPRELPHDFVFIGGSQENVGKGFDPTLPVTRTL
ncbi:MAG: helix-turn-helix transcriptional regulator [Oscillospiraceae bacterium]|nr:helix-turn-helix transcriptional regulator [Oscillospiraceae bacterium]